MVSTLNMRRSNPSARRRIAVWVPSVVVLLFFLFHIEVIGCVSHLFRRSVFASDHYRVSVPLIWTIQQEGTEYNDRPYFWAVAGKGLARGGKAESWGYGRKAIAHIEAHWLEQESNPQWWLSHKFSSSQPRVTFTWAVRGGYVVCGESAQGPGFAMADCFAKSEISDSLLHLSFFGGTEMLPEFYSFIQRDVRFVM